MKIVFTNRAIRHLHQILAYLESHSPTGKANVQSKIDYCIQLIEEQPFSGRRSSVPGVYIKVVNPFPYLIFYRVKSDTVLILTIRHAARRPIG
jgi:toxin ParE1/3/4